MRTSKKRLKTFFFCMGLVLMGLAGFVGVAHMISLAISKVASGRGLETFRTVWLVEFNHIGLLVALAGVVLSLLVAGGFWLRDWWQWRDVEKKYGADKTRG